MSHNIPDLPWAKMGTHLFSYNGKDYLVTVDYYSIFWEVDYLADTGGQTIIGKLKADCARHGIPDTVMSSAFNFRAGTDSKTITRQHKVLI